MKKRVFGKKLKRNVNQRKALFRSLISALVIHGGIKTTEAKAKAVRGEVEKLVTKAKNKKEEARHDLLKTLLKENLVEKMISQIAPNYTNRPGGYTRIIKLGARQKDNAKMVLLEFVDLKIEEKKKKQKKTKKKVVKAKPSTNESKKSTNTKKEKAKK